MTRKPAKRDRKKEEERRPSASPVCYLEDPEIDPAYLWAEEGDAKSDADGSSRRPSPRPRGEGGPRRRR